MTDEVRADIKQILYRFGRDGEPAEGAEHFWANVQVLIGEVGEDDADAFDIVVYSPSMLATQFDPASWEEEDVLAGTNGNVHPVTGLWLMRSWSRADLEAGIRRVVQASNPGPDFGVVATRIGQLIPWEYDYRYDATVNEQAGLPRSTSAWHDG